MVISYKHVTSALFSVTSQFGSFSIFFLLNKFLKHNKSDGIINFSTLAICTSDNLTQKVQQQLERMTDPLISRTRLMQIITEELTRSQQSQEGVGTMKLIGLSIQSISPEAIELIRESVERLSLQNNLMSSLPQYFNRLDKLRYLDIHDNKFNKFPDILTKMNDLEILDISFNDLVDLPSDMGSLKNLKVLSIKNNKFETIPKSILSIKNLKILEIENNPLKPHIQNFIGNITYKEHSQEWLQEIKTFLLTSDDEAEDHASSPPEIFHDVQTTIEGKPLHQHLERSRSTSESYVSSRAAKRMGFIIKRPNQDLTNDTIKEQQETHPPPIYNTSIPDNKRNRSFSTSTVTLNSTPVQPNSNLESPASTSNFTTVSPSVPERLDLPQTNRSNDYFKRLSTLPEETRSESTPSTTQLPTFKIIEISRKVLFAINEFTTTLKKLNSFCSQKQTIVDIVSTLYSSKIEIEHLVDSLERTEEKHNAQVVESVSFDEVVKNVTATVVVFKKLIRLLQSNFENYVKNTDVCFIRMLFMSLFLSYTEIYNAYKILTPTSTFTSSSVSTTTAATTTTTFTSSTKKERNQLPALRIPDHSAITITQQQLNEYNEIDDELYESLSNALHISNQVYSELNNSLSASALSNANSAITTNQPSNISNSGGSVEDFSPTVISRIRELTSTCVVSMELNKKIRQKLSLRDEIFPNNGIQEKKKFYDEINSYLKSIISILGLTKAIMNESSILNEVRPSLSNLTKATKDVTIMLEVSSYRLINDSFSTNNSMASATPSSNNTVPQSATIQTPMLTSIPSVMSIPQMNTNFININSAAALTNNAPGQNSSNIALPTSSVNTPAVTSSYNGNMGSNPFEISMMNNMENGD